MNQENKNEQQKEINVKDQEKLVSNNMGKTIFVTILITIIVMSGLVFLLYKYDKFLQAEQLDAQKEKTALENRIATLEKNKADNSSDVKSGAHAAVTNKKPVTQNNSTLNDVNTVPGESGESEHAAPQSNDGDVHPAAEHNPHDAMNQNIGDTAGLYTVDIPLDWVITENEGAMGMQVSRVIADSPDFSYHVDYSVEGPFEPFYYDTGATISIHVTQFLGALSEPIAVSIQNSQRVVDGVTAQYYIFKEPSTFAGEILAAIFEHDGNEYYFRFTYNPDSYPQGPDVFAQILDSVSLN